MNNSSAVMSFQPFINLKNPPLFYSLKQSILSRNTPNNYRSIKTH